MAKQNLEKALEIAGNEIIVIFDRNYVSLEMFLWLNERNIKYVMRLTDKFYKKEIENMKSSF